MKKLFNFSKLVLMVLLIGVGLFLLYTFIILKPSNTRDWEIGFERLPKITIANNNIMVDDIRDFHYLPGGRVTPGYLNRTFDVSKITRVWFVFEPFAVKPFTNFKGVAHTYFVFDFSDQEPLAVSVEARREKGEKYKAEEGLFNKYELIYIWGSEQDETIKRVIGENNPLYMYPLNISEHGKQQLLLQLASASDSLESKPRFYNTLTDNCTNELAKSANKVKPNTIPFDISLFLPGFSDQKLYDLQLIPTNQPFEQIKQKYYISDYVKEFYDKSDFATLLRAKLDNI